MLSWALWNGRAGVDLSLALGVRACLLVLFLAVVRRLGGAPAPGVGARDPDGLHDVLQREAAAEAGGAAARVAVSAGELGAATRAYRMPNCTLRMSTGRMIMLTLRAKRDVFVCVSSLYKQRQWSCRSILERDEERKGEEPGTPEA